MSKKYNITHDKTLDGIHIYLDTDTKVICYDPDKFSVSEDNLKNLGRKITIYEVPE